MTLSKQSILTAVLALPIGLFAQAGATAQDHGATSTRSPDGGVGRFYSGGPKAVSAGFECDGDACQKPSQKSCVVIPVRQEDGSITTDCYDWVP